MTKLSDKRIVLGISGSIAAYKSPEIVRRLREYGAKVYVVMTSAAKKFITPLSLKAVSDLPVVNNYLGPTAKTAIDHIDLAKWADLILLAPATANLLARLAAGFANDLLSVICLATSAPIAAAPAMNKQMYQAAATQNNLATLRDRGVLIWGPDNGNLACGDIGPGCMFDPLILVDLVYKQFISDCSLSHLNIMITAGPTHEAIDPVRFISNYSSGKMGFAIANAAVAKGAKVTLISGPVDLPTPPGVRRINVISALEMQDAVMRIVQHQQIFIGCAAVADYRVNRFSSEKIKKQSNELTINMIKNPDIISSVSALTEKRPYVVGFAADTRNVEEYARQKRITKHLDLICANDISNPNQGLNSDSNALHLFWQDGETSLPVRNKTLLAQQLIEEIVSRYYDKKN